MPMDRPGADADRALASVLAQNPFEIIVVTGNRLDLDTRVRQVVVPDRNPATRRNRAADVATGDVLAFIDDDAFAQPAWIANAVAFLEANPDVVALGGPDPAPDDATTGELFSETLLATPWIGSGIAAHEQREESFDVREPHDIALVNLFVRKEAFAAAGGFDEGIGYIGEDTALVSKLLTRGRVVYRPDVVVHHRRRAFPGAYLRQRWNYRLKTGKLLASGVGSYRSPKIVAFLAMGFFFLTTLVVAPLIAASLFGVYSILAFLLGLSVTRLAIGWWPLIPFAFALHHATYFAGIIGGLIIGFRSRLAPPRAIRENTDEA